MKATIGGLPVSITTPASGTAFDIVGKNTASLEGLKQAFLLCTRRGEIRKRNTASLMLAIDLREDSGAPPKTLLPSGTCDNHSQIL